MDTIPSHARQKDIIKYEAFMEAILNFNTRAGIQTRHLYQQCVCFEAFYLTAHILHCDSA